MKHGSAIIFLILSLLLAVQSLPAAGPVVVTEQGSLARLSNDFLERDIDASGGVIQTVRLVNKLTGRVHEARGDEFELNLTFERLGYTFGSENPLVLTAKDFRVKDHSVQDAGGGKRLVYHLALDREPQAKTGLEATLVYELKPQDFFTRQWLELKTMGTGTYFINSLALGKNLWPGEVFVLGGFGQPLFASDLFLGLEYPSSLNTAQGSAVSLAIVVGLDIPPGGYTSEPAVLGVAGDGNVHRAFMQYVARMRVAPVRPYVLYNTWYDLQRTAMNRDNLLERVAQLDQELVKKYEVPLDSFLLDDGWDDMNNLWVIDPQRFRNGFRELVTALKGINSHLGLWFGPVGGYDQRQLRIAAGRRQGMEITTNGQYLCLAGRHYSRYLREKLLQYQKEYGVNAFKLDGVPFGCNAPDHGHPVGLYSREADMRSFIGTLQALRAQDPKVFLNITTSLWLSPWWLRYADTVWMGGEDYGHLETLPALTPRQSSMNYRDMVLYNDFVRHRVQFPMSSLMTQSVIKGTYLKLGGEHESLDDWRDHLINFFGVGSQLNELYITPSLLTAEERDALGRSLRWAVANAHPLLDNATWVLGDPARRQPYGILHYSPAKTIVMLRNPFVCPAEVDVKLDEQAGFEPTNGSFMAEVIYPYRESLPGELRYGDSLDATLDGYEHKIVEIRPLARGEARVEGIRYSVEPGARSEVGFRVYAPDGATATARLARAFAYQRVDVDDEALQLAPQGDEATATLHFGGRGSHPSQITFSAPTIEPAGSGGTRISLTVNVPADFRSTTASLLVECPQPVEVRVEALDNGGPASIATEEGGKGLWYWFAADLTSGPHALAFTLHLPPEMAGRIRLSGWLRARRQLLSKNLRLTFKPGNQLAAPPEDPLPTSSGIEKLTYALFAERTL